MFQMIRRLYAKAKAAMRIAPKTATGGGDGHLLRRPEPPIATDAIVARLERWGEAERRRGRYDLHPGRASTLKKVARVARIAAGASGAHGQKASADR